MGDEDPAPRRRRTGGLWRLLPFATVGLLALGNYRHATEGRVDGLDGQDYVILATLIAAFLAFYGKPAPAEDAGAAPRPLGPVVATILAVAAALLFSLAPFARFMPHSSADWRVAGMDLIVTWLLVDFFQAWLRPARGHG
jgi:hypothetical protein